MSVQRAIARGLMRLPRPLLRRLAGGEPLTIDGRTMDLRAQVISSLGARGPSLTAGSPARARRITAQSFAASNAPRRPGVSVHDATVPGPDGARPVRHYVPAGGGSGPRPGILYFHMGGWVIGDLETCDHFCSLLAETCGAHVVSLDYRLAPEHRFPAAMEDAFAAYEWLLAESASLGIDATRLAVTGDSAGGCMTAVVCQEMRRRDRPQPRLQVPIYPTTDLNWEGGSRDSCANVYPLTREIMEWFLGHWLPTPAQSCDVRASPLHEPDLRGLAPALVVTAGFDILRDEGEAYARALEAAGVPTTYRCFDALPHAFTALAGLVPAAAAANAEIAAFVREALQDGGTTGRS